MPRHESTRNVVGYVAMIGIALIVALGAAEVALRLIPIPGITYHSFYYDDVTGQRFYPGSTFIYRNERGDHVRRRVNDWGYLDARHEIAKPAGVVRLGFFGDSFAEARQVPLEETFAYRIETRLNQAAAPRYESISIAMMGYSTLQCYLESQRWTDRLDLDDIVYVFCENDPGNNIRALNFSDAVPYPIAEGDSFVVDRSFAFRHARKGKWPHRTWQFLKSNSLLFSTLETRLNLLRSRGVDVRVDDAERGMGAPAESNARVDAVSPPSLWPDSLRAQAMTVTERVIVRWKREIESSGRRFAIAYVPRPVAIEKPSEPEDSWHGWLRDVCTRNEIPMIDPTGRFLKTRADGDEVYFDHFTSAGHAAFAEELLGWIRSPEPGSGR